MKYLITTLILVFLIGCTDETQAQKNTVDNASINQAVAVIDETKSFTEEVNEDIVSENTRGIINQQNVIENTSATNDAESSKAKMYPEKLLGTWMRTDIDTGFTLLKNGSIETINSKGFTYKTWEKENNKIIFLIIKEDGTSLKETYNIKESTDTKLVLSNGKKDIEYTKQN